MALQVSFEKRSMSPPDFANLWTPTAGYQLRQGEVKFHSLVSTRALNSSHMIVDQSVRVFGASRAMIEGKYEYPKLTFMDAITA